MKTSVAAQLFQLGRNTINLWLKRQAETGDYQAKSNRPHRIVNKITDWEEFAEFASRHGDKTQAEMAALWEGDISARTISRALQKLEWSRKKTYGYRERDESKRTSFVAQLAEIPTSQRVYVDESGMDERDRRWLRMV